jgi:AsmA protein
MAKLIKILVGLILLLVVAIIAIPMVLDPNDYREQIQTAVKENTGRDLSINGDLKLSVFPWIGIGINEVSLSNAKGFKAEYFAQIKKADIKVKLLPLLSKQVEVSTIVLSGMQLNLAKNKQGTTNWDDLSQASKADKTSKTKESDTASDVGIAALAIGGLQVDGANINWSDASKGENHSISDFDLKTDALSLDAPMGVNLAFTLASNKPKMTTRLKLDGDLVIDNALNKFTFQNMKLGIDTAGDPIPNGAMEINVASTLVADLAGSGAISLDPLKISFDDTNINGKAAVKNLSNPAINVNLAIDSINVDRYLPKTTDGDGSQKTAKVAPAPAGAALIPVQTLRDLNLTGLINIKSMIVNGLKGADAHVKVVAKNGVLTTEQGVKTFYNGTYAGKTIVDARQNTPKITVKEQASSISIEPLLIDLMGESPISGTANLKANLTTRGNTIPAFKSALNGTASFSFQDGAVTGVDVGALMKQAQAVLNGNLSAAFEKGTGKTPFTDLSGTAQITNGLVKNNDLLVKTPLVNVSGKGNAHLVSEKIDYTLNLQRTGTASAEEAGTGDSKNILIPVIVGGTFEKPSFKLDVKSIVMSTQKAKIDEKKEELKEKVNEKIGEKLKGKAGDLLKGLF